MRTYWQEMSATPYTLFCLIYMFHFTVEETRAWHDPASTGTRVNMAERLEWTGWHLFEPNSTTSQLEDFG